MKKALLTTILLCAVAMTAASQPVIVPPTVASEGLHGPVKMVMSSTIFNTNEGDAAISTSQTWLFDSAGRLTDNISMSEDGMHDLATYRYDAHGRLASASHWGGDASRDEKYIYANDGRLLRIEVSWHQDESTHAYLVTGYDAQKRTTVIKDTANREITYRYSYDDAGRLKTSSYTMFGKPIVTYYGPYGIDSTVSEGAKTTYQYNERGELFFERYKHFSISTEPQWNYTYDSDWHDKYGNWHSRRITLPDGTECTEDRLIIFYDEENKQK